VVGGCQYRNLVTGHERSIVQSKRFPGSRGNVLLKGNCIPSSLQSSFSANQATLGEGGSKRYSSTSKGEKGQGKEKEARQDADNRRRKAAQKVCFRTWGEPKPTSLTHKNRGERAVGQGILKDLKKTSLADRRLDPSFNFIPQSPFTESWVAFVCAEVSETGKSDNSQPALFRLVGLSPRLAEQLSRSRESEGLVSKGVTRNGQLKSHGRLQPSPKEGGGTPSRRHRRTYVRVEEGSASFPMFVTRDTSPLQGEGRNPPLTIWGNYLLWGIRVLVEEESMGGHTGGYKKKPTVAVT